MPVGNELIIVAQRGLSGPFLRTFARVRKDDGCACGKALRLRKMVVIRDIEKDADFAAFLEDAKSAGFRGSKYSTLYQRWDVAGYGLDPFYERS